MLVSCLALKAAKWSSYKRRLCVKWLYSAEDLWGTGICLKVALNLTFYTKFATLINFILSLYHDEIKLIMFVNLVDSSFSIWFSRHCMSCLKKRGSQHLALSSYQGKINCSSGNQTNNTRFYSQMPCCCSTWTVTLKIINLLHTFFLTDFCKRRRISI